MLNMSVLSAAASVGTEMVKTRVEIPAMVTPSTELIKTTRRSEALLSAVAAGLTNQKLRKRGIVFRLNHTAAAFATADESPEHASFIFNFPFSIINLVLFLISAASSNIV